MIPESELWESNVLRNLQRSYEARGFKFHINPSRELVPPFLAGYTPDVIAVGPDGGGIVIEVKRQRTPATDRPLAELAKKVAEQNGWEFRAIYTNPSSERPDEIAKPTAEQIDARLQEIQVLADTGHYAPALIFGWATLESLARMASGSGSSRGYSPIQAVQALAEEGYLEQEEAQRLREMARLRSAVVHGDFSVNVSAEQVEFLLEQLRVLDSNISKAAAEHGGGTEVPRE
jgi:REase_AHJR-like protein/ribonuclease HepT-like protein